LKSLAEALIPDFGPILFHTPVPWILNSIEYAVDLHENAGILIAHVSEATVDFGVPVP
jgi:hypothetical protein